MSKPPNASASALKPSDLPVSRLVQAESATMDIWLRQTAKRRTQHSLKDRLETLFWSWPIRLAERRGYSLLRDFVDKGCVTVHREEKQLVRRGIKNTHPVHPTNGK